MNFYGHYIGDYQRDTADLSLLEHGAYRLLLDAYYASESPLPADEARLFRIAKAVTPDEQAAVSVVSARFFPLGPDGLRHNQRADRELVLLRERIATARANGRRGGRPPKETQPKPSGFPGDNPEITQRVSQKEPSGLTSQSQSQSTTTTLAAARVRGEMSRDLTAVANRVLDDRFGVNRQPLLPGTATAVLEVVEQEGVTADFALEAIAEMAGRVVKPPSTMGYFAPGLRQRWSERGARTDAAGAVIRNGASTTRQDRNLAAITEGLKRYGK